MGTKDVYESKIKNTGSVNFKELYNFCYGWLSDETNLIVAEDKYVEKTTKPVFIAHVLQRWDAVPSLQPSFDRGHLLTAQEHYAQTFGLTLSSLTIRDG